MMDLIKTLHLKYKFVVISLVLSVFLFPCMASAADLSNDSSASVPYLAPDLESAELYNIAQQLSDTRATSYTTTDIYNLLNSIRVSASGQYKFNVQDTTTHNYILTLRNHLDDIFGYNTAYNYHDMIKDIWSRIGGNSSSSGNLIDLILQLNQNILYTIGDETYSLGELLYNCYVNTNSINSKLSTVNNNLSDIASNISILNSNISHLADDINNITWSTPNYQFLGVSKTLNGEYINTNYTTSNDFYVKFNIYDNFSDFPNIFRIYLPIYKQSYLDMGIPPFNFEMYANSDKIIGNFDYFSEITYSGTYIYLIDFSTRLNTNYSIHIHCDTNMYYNNTNNGYISFVPFDTLDYHVIKNSFYQKKASQGSDALNKLAEVYASDDLIQAKQNQQSYEDEVVTDFTGSGSGASTVSDKNGLKSVTSNIKSGLNTGGSIGNALSVFNTNNSLWQFFTTNTQNNVDTRSGSNNRSFNLRNSNDTVLDFISERDREYYSHLGE